MDKLIETIKKVNSKELPDQYQSLIQAIGVEATVKVAKVFGGENVYFPQIERFLGDYRDELIKQEFNGYNYKELAKKYGLSSRWIRTIVAGKGTKKARKVDKDA